jgi:uridine monophosphate synthetase
MIRSQKKLAIRLTEVGAIKFGAFRLKFHDKDPEASLSPIYIDLRTPDNKNGRLTPELVRSIGEQIFNAVREAGVKFDLVAGHPRAGEPFAEVISQLSKKPLIKLGKKVEGGQRKIYSIVEGEYQPQQRILLIDDLITWADTKKEAIKVCVEAGLLIAGIAVLIDREQGGSEELRKMNYNVYAVFKLSMLLKYYLTVGKIGEIKFKEIMDYIAANKLQ